MKLKLDGVVVDAVSMTKHGALSIPDNTSLSLPPIPVNSSRNIIDVTVMDGVLYALCSGTPNDSEISSTSTLQVYKWNGVTWSFMVEFNQWNAGSGFDRILGCNGKLYLRRNTGSGTSYSETLYEINNGALVSRSTRSHDGRCKLIVFNNEIHALGGWYASSSNDKSKQHLKWNGSSWVTVSTLPYRFTNGYVVVYKGQLHIIGGQKYTAAASVSGGVTSHYVFNGTSWVSATALSTASYDGKAVEYNGSIYIFENTASHVYKFNGSAWSTVSTSITLNTHQTVATYKGLLHHFYVYGTTGTGHVCLAVTFGNCYILSNL